MKKNNNKNTWGFSLEDMDTEVRPQDDFFAYANGGWLKNNEIPSDEAAWGRFYELRDNNQKRIRTILQDVLKNKEGQMDAPHHQLVRNLYSSGMDIKGRNERKLIPLAPQMKDIHDIASKKDLLTVIGKMHRVGLQPLWHIYVGQDEKKSDKNIPYISQGGLSLPDRDYYLNEGEDFVRIRAEYQLYLVALHKKMGLTPAEAQLAAAVIITIETRLAKASMTQVELRDIAAQYNKTLYAKFLKMFNAENIDTYFKTIKLKKVAHIIISQPLYIKEVNSMFDDVSLEDWKTYLSFKTVDGTTAYLAADMKKTAFSFYGKVLSGVDTMKPLWERVATAIDGHVGDALGQLYTEKYFSQESKKRVTVMVESLCDSYAEHIKQLDWMEDSTKKKALVKLKAMGKKLGYPDTLKTYKTLELKEGTYLENILACNTFEFDRMIKKYGKPVDRTEWGMTPSTVNAYCNFNMNEIVFPAGIMQAPFFNTDIEDDAVNYGAMGAVIGHEITHGFDDMGKDFDAKGNMKNWWTETDKKTFDAKTKKVSTQFSKHEVLPEIFVNGDLTLGENIADIGGVAISYDAYMASKPEGEIDGFTPAQRFFLGYAAVWGSKARPEYTKMIINTDPHAPAKVRVNGPLSNTPEFYKAFNVKKGDELYRSAATRVQLW